MIEFLQFDLLFLKTGEVRQPDPRKILFLLDTIGNVGKSSFFKYLYFKNPTSIGRVTYGSASQLRSSFINNRTKKIYIVDLPRTKGKEDRIEEILSTIEDAKNGMISSNMYGVGTTLLMEPPHIIVSSNYVIDQNALSEDRWESYEIQKASKKLKNVIEALKRNQKSNEEI